MEEGAGLRPFGAQGKLSFIGCLHLLYVASQAPPSNPSTEA